MNTNPSSTAFTVILQEHGSVGWTYFTVSQADNAEHAEEQAENAYPGCKVLWVNEGEDYEMH
jgi:predicted negative regulator of RcsB-dependent stress response